MNSRNGRNIGGERRPGRRPPEREANAKNRRRAAESRRGRRAVYVGMFLCACIMGLWFRLYYIQAGPGQEFAQWAVMQDVRRHVQRATNDIAPVRGTITDRNLNPIVSSQPRFTVFLDVTELQRRHVANRDFTRDVREEVFEALGELFNVSRRELADRFELNPDGTLVRPTNHFIVARGVEPDIAFEITDRFPEVHADQESVRFFHDPWFAPQVIGFHRGDATWGLELLFDRELTGDPGRTVWVAGEIEEIPVRDGYTVVTTLDPEIQRRAQEYVDRIYTEHPSRHVGIIVMDPNTSEIFAMAQAPTFRLDDTMSRNSITNTELAENWYSLSNEDLIDGMMHMWRNYHTTMSGEPGSVFKPVVMAAAVEEGLVDINSHFYCEGVRDVGDERIWCWNNWGHGAIGFSAALAESCNLAMVDINNLLGRDTFYQYRGYFGFGELTGINLPGEWAVSESSVMYERHRLGEVEMGTSSMGQGFNATTLQSINAMAAIINGGVLMRPFIVSHILDADGNVVQEILPQEERRVISEQTSDFMRREMQHVLTMNEMEGDRRRRGTALSANIPGHSIAGKTGTAQQGEREDGRNSLTLILYTPVENPEFIVLMTIDSIYDSTALAGGVLSPFMRSFMLWLITTRNIQPSEGPDAVELWHATQAQRNLMPDFRGQRLADVARNVNIMNQGGYHVIGSGIYIEQTIPAPGQPMPNNAPIFFHMDASSVVEAAMETVPDVVGLTLTEASQFLLDSGLTSETVRSARREGADDAFEPRTTNPTPREEEEEEEEEILFVYRQFPSPGVRVERGTEILLRVR